MTIRDKFEALLATKTTWGRREIIQQYDKIVTEEQLRQDSPWSNKEDRALAKELRQALDVIAQKHQRTCHEIVAHIKEAKILF